MGLTSRLLVCSIKSRVSYALSGPTVMLLSVSTMHSISKAASLSAFPVARVTSPPYSKPASSIHEHMAHIAKLRLMPLAHSLKPGIRICARAMGVVSSFLPPEVLFPVAVTSSKSFWANI